MRNQSLRAARDVRRAASRAAGATMQTGQRLAIERLELRVLLSAYVVTSSADAGSGSLRDAIAQVNVGQFNEIDFDIQAGGLRTIAVASSLPAITAAFVTIDGTT